MTAIRVELQLADGSFTGGMLRAGQSLAQFQQQLVRTNPQLAQVAANGGNVIRSMTAMDSSTKGFLSTLRDVSIVTGLVSMGLSKMTGAANGWVGDIVRINAEMEKLTFQMRAMATSADPIKEAGDNVKYLREQATQMPFSLKTITSGFVRLKATGTDPMNGSLKAIADGIASFGGSDEDFNRTILGITQAAGKGVLQMEELRQQIGESMPNAMQLLARSMGLTVGQLAKEISTGTVASRPALEKLYDELNRVYGGTSQRMMRTFNGQITQLNTNIQNLATNEGGRGFFDQVKNQLQDINRFLSSDMANQFAIRLGQGLSSVIQGLRTAIVTIFEFRDEITRVGTIVAGGLGMLALARGIQSLTGAVTAAGFAWQIFRTNMAEAVSNITLGVTGFRNMTTATTGLSFVLMGMRGAFGAILTGFTAFAPLIVGVGVAAYTAGEYFGLFKDRVGDAYEELKKFGAESEDIARKTVEAKRNQLQERIDSMKNARALGGQGWDEEIAAAEKEKAQFEIESPKFIQDAAKAENDKKLNAFKESLQDAVAAQQQAYAKLQMERDNANDAETAKAGEHEESLAQIKKKYADDTRTNQQNLTKAIIKEYDTRLSDLNQRLMSASGSEKDLIQQQIAYINSLRNPKYQESLALKDKTFGVDYTSVGVDETKAVNRGKKALAELQADIAKIQANMNGASGAAAEMAEKIANNDFGSIKEGGEEVAKLHDELMAAAEAKETLDKVMRSNQKADKDLENIQQDIREKKLALLERQQGRPLDDAQKMLLKLDNDGYFGLGSFENIKKALGDIVGAMNVQGKAAENIGNYMRDNTFGTETVKKVDTVTDAINRLKNSILGVGQGLNTLNFQNLGQGLPALNNFQGGALQGMAGFSGLPTRGANLMSKNMDIFGDPRSTGWKDNNITSVMASNGMTVQVHKAAAEAFKGFLDDLLASGYKVKSVGGYSLRNKVSGNSLSEHAFGNAIDINPEQNPYGKSLVTDMPGNIREMAAKWGLSWGGDWNSVKDAMHFEWRGGSNPGRQEQAPAPQQQPSSLVPFQPTVLDNQIDKTQELRDGLNAAHEAYVEIGKQTSDQDLTDWIKETEAETKTLGEGAEEAGKRYNQLKKAILDGKFDKAGNPDDRNPEAERFKKALDAAKAFDAAQKQVTENKKLDRKTEADAQKFEERRVELNRRIAEMQAKVKDPKYIPDSQELQRLQTDLDGYVDDVLKRAGGDTTNAAYKQALDTRANLLRGQRQLEATEAQVSFNKETKSLQNALLTQSQLRQKNLQEALAAVDTWLEQQKKNGADEVEVTRMAEEQKALIRQKYAQDMSPMQKQFKEWGDLQGNLSQASARWMDSLADGIAGLVTGTGDLKQALQGILKDIVSMGVKYLMSGMFGNKGGQQSSGGKKGAASAVSRGGKKGGQAALAAGGKGGKGAAVGLFHTGGIIGAGARPSKMISAAAFHGARKFHTGGIVDSLLPSEVPIIAKKGEGVFTPDQMDAMGGFSGGQKIEINSPITVQGSAGTPEQNNDLAKKMAREYETSIRSTVADEIRKQTKVGNYMNQKAR